MIPRLPYISSNKISLISEVSAKRAHTRGVTQHVSNQVMFAKVGFWLPYLSVYMGL